MKAEPLPRAGTHPMIADCPNCGTKRATGERFCFWCLEDYEKYTGCCTECGQPKDLTLKVAEFIRRSRRE